MAVWKAKVEEMGTIRVEADAATQMSEVFLQSPGGVAPEWIPDSPYPSCLLRTRVRARIPDLAVLAQARGVPSRYVLCLIQSGRRLLSISVCYQ